MKNHDLDANIMTSLLKEDEKQREEFATNLPECQDYRFSKHTIESMDFQEGESMMWRQHHLKRHTDEELTWWNNARRIDFYRWLLVILCGVLIALLGAGVDELTSAMQEWRFNRVLNAVDDGHYIVGCLIYVSSAIGFALGAALLCVYKPAAAGSGIPEVKAYLNGMKIKNLLRADVLFPKFFGMCLACASGLPLGKEGPMIHVGAVLGAAVSQGKSVLAGQDVSWTKFQELRCDSSKRDYVTFGAAAGIAAAFRAPIGGILFTLEEGASFWSTNLIFQAFLCATITQLTMMSLFREREINSGMITFGTFDNLDDGKTNFRYYELLIFMGIGVGGGILGASFVHMHEELSRWRNKRGIGRGSGGKYAAVLEVMVITLVMAVLSFLVTCAWSGCTDLPESTSDWTAEERDLLDELVSFGCPDGKFNQVASLYFVKPSTALMQLFHFREYDGSSYTTFDTGALMLFSIPYFLVAALTAGILVPVGLFVPSLLAGAGFGRIIGHILNVAFPGRVADSGTYALVGAAALLGGIGRMTIAGTVILLEACGNTAYLLPLMVAFGCARYAGNGLGDSIYDVMMELKRFPFLDGSPKSLGLIDFQPIADYMTPNVVTFRVVEKVSVIYEALVGTKHNAFPVVSETGHLVGLIYRKHITTLLKLRAFSYPTDINSSHPEAVPLRSSKPVFLKTLEKTYPHYPSIDEISIADSDMSLWLDLRIYMDLSPLAISQKASVLKSYKLFRTQGLRHLVVLDDDHKVVGIVTRHDITPEALKRIGLSPDSRALEFSVLAALPPAYVDMRQNFDYIDYHTE